MGDGISDLVIRGEAGEDAERDHITARIRNADGGVWQIHKTSVSCLTLWRTIRAMQSDGLVNVDEATTIDWWRITLKEPTDG